MIEVRDLSKRYGDKLAVDHLTFTVRPGMVTGLPRSERRRQVDDDAHDPRPRPADDGLGDGQRQGLPRPRARRCARSARSSRRARSTPAGLPTPHLLALGQTHGIPRSRVDEVIGLVGLQDVARKRVGTFSLGMGQRLGIAAALLGDPKTLILDEPSNGLDPEGIRWIRNLLRSLADEGRTIFVSSHLMSEMSMMADWLIVVGRGRLIADTTVEDFVHLASGDAVRVRTPELARLRSIAEALEGVTVQGRRTATAPALTIQGMSCEAVGELAAANRIVLHELAPEQASLEEAFMRLTDGLRRVPRRCRRPGESVGAAR